MFVKKAILGMALVIVGLVESQAGIALVVAKNDDHINLAWEVAHTDGLPYKAGDIAKKRLKAKGYKRVYKQEGGEKRGHYLNSGYWVVVKCNRKRYDGKSITTYGLGASSESYTEAKERAISNLAQYDWNYSSRKHTCVIEQKGMF